MNDEIQLAKNNSDYSELIVNCNWSTGVFGEPRRRSVPSIAGAQHFNPPTPESVATASAANLIEQPLTESTLSDA